jgi:hypothetical protein
MPYAFNFSVNIEKNRGYKAKAYLAHQTHADKGQTWSHCDNFCLSDIKHKISVVIYLGGCYGMIVNGGMVGGREKRKRRQSYACDHEDYSFKID